MPFMAFDELFPEIARHETRCLTVQSGAGFDLPAGEYLWVEMFCDELKCDCRRVFFDVFSMPHQRHEAVIAWGWETRRFYVKWLGCDDADMLAELQGPVLNLCSPQLEHANILLRLTEELLLGDLAYVERIKRHYRMFRDQIDANGARSRTKQARGD